MFPALSSTQTTSSGSYTDTVKLWETMPGNHHGETVLVSPRQMEELKTAQDVIDTVKENLSAGTGNQKTDYMLFEGRNYQHAVAARHVRDVDYRGDNQAIVKSALATQGGTCGEHSALAMAYLSMMNLERPIYTYGVENHHDHQLNVIGDLREPHSAVIVDSWPVFARAHLADNAAFHPAANKMLDVHLPGTDPKFDDFSDILPLGEERIVEINTQKQTPDYNEVLNNPGSIRLEECTHGVVNLGVRYQNQDNAADVLENIAERAIYDRQAQAMQQARRYFPKPKDEGGND